MATAEQTTSPSQQFEVLAALPGAEAGPHQESTSYQALKQPGQCMPVHGIEPHAMSCTLPSRITLYTQQSNIIFSDKHGQ